MQKDSVEEIKRGMVELSIKIRQENINKNKSAKNSEKRQKSQSLNLLSITYYKELQFKDVGLSEQKIYVVKLEGEDKKEVYQIYNENKQLIMEVDITGKIHFRPEYIESLKEIDENYVETLNLEDATFEMPKELEKEDISLQEFEIEETREKLEEKGILFASLDDQKKQTKKRKKGKQNR